MNFSILIPHYRTGKISAYTIAQLLKYKGKHEIEIIVIDNNIGDGSAEYIWPFSSDIRYIAYPKDRLQSHGAAFDFALNDGLVSNEHFITIESDSFPTNDKWLDRYEKLINEGYDCAGSLLKLSGGTYVHPAGTFYKKSIWEEAKKVCDNINYDYFPNMSIQEGFDCHLMIRKDKTQRVAEAPHDFMELAKGYIGLNYEQVMGKRDYYLPVTGVFHNGMGNLKESIKTFGNRDTRTGIEDMIFDNKLTMISRIGYEPGQAFCYWQLANNKKVALIPTEIKWMRNRGGQQQEYTLMDNGFKHLWAGSAYLGMKDTEFNDVYEFKKNAIDNLYDSLPQNQKVNI